MTKTVLVVLAVALFPAYVFAVDGVVLINQSTVMAAGGFPYTISVPGSYKLSGSLLVPSGINGIEITASNVTLDLNGFNMSAAGASSLVKTIGAVTGVTVRNGKISSAAGGGLVKFSGASGTVVEDITLLGGNGGGVDLGSSVIVRRVSYPGSATQIQITCPALVVDSLAGAFNRTNPGATCVFGFISGDVI